MLTHKVVLLGAVALVADLIVYYLLGYNAVTLLTQVIVLGVAVTVTLSWLFAALQAFGRGGRSAADKITISIWLVWAILTVQRMYALIATQLGKPAWLIESPITSLIVTCIIVAGAYVAFATVSDGKVPKQERGWVLFSTFCGGLVAGGFGVYALITQFNPFG